MAMKITGLDKLQRTLKDAQKAAQSLDGDMAGLEYDPADPGSVKAAIKHMDQTIDRKVGRYKGNPIVDNMMTQLKAHYRDGINKQAREARKT